MGVGVAMLQAQCAMDVSYGVLLRQTRWVESISRMIAMGVTTFVEVGPKDVLCGLIKRIDGRVTVVSVGTEADIAALEVG